jgi:predicted nucleic acid-binding protein
VTTASEPIRIFIDSNVLIEALFAPWSASRAILILARAGVFRLVISPYVIMEVERALLNNLGNAPEEGARVIDDYDLALRLVSTEKAATVTREEINAHRGLIRHWNDFPVLLSAIKAQPDWLAASNTKHFTQQAQRELAYALSLHANC